MSEPKADALPLGEAAHRRIRADILACRLAPGQRLTERGLAAQLGMGISPIRDALTRLDDEGLIRTIPRKGYQVKPLTIQSADHMFDFWAIIGPEIARRGVVKATEAQLQQALAYVDELSQVTGRDDALKQTALRGEELASRLFQLLAEASGNEYLINACTHATGELARLWTMVIDSELHEAGRTVGSFEEWREALTQRNGDALVELSRRHIEQSHTRVLLTLARWPSVVTSEVVPIGTTSDRTG